MYGILGHSKPFRFFGGSFSVIFVAIGWGPRRQKESPAPINKSTNPCAAPNQAVLDAITCSPKQTVVTNPADHNRTPIGP